VGQNQKAVWKAIPQRKDPRGIAGKAEILKTGTGYRAEESWEKEFTGSAIHRHCGKRKLIKQRSQDPQRETLGAGKGEFKKSARGKSLKKPR